MMTFFSRSIVNFISLLILLFMKVPAQAQEAWKIGSSQVSLSPVRLVDVVNPGLEIAFEQIYAKRWSTQVSAGYMKDFFNASPLKHYEGWRASIEERFYLERTRHKRNYLAVDVVYLDVEYEDAAWFRADGVGSPRYSDPFDVIKRHWIFNVKYGLQIPVRRFVFDFSAGIGLKHRLLKMTGYNEAGHYESGSRQPSLFQRIHKNADGLTLSVPANIRVGYRF